MSHSVVSSLVPSTAEVLAAALRGKPALSEFDKRLIEVLHDDIFKRREGLRADEATQLAYKRLRHLQARMQLRIDELMAAPDKLLSLHTWTGLVDGTVVTLLTIHYNLCIGSIMQMGMGREVLKPVLAELECMDSVGVFLATELEYGSNVVDLQTEAEYRPDERAFVLRTVSRESQKFMPNTGAPGIPKIAVVMARLKVAGEDCGVYPFLVRLRTATGLAPGIQITPLGEKPDYALDNAITSFHDVHVPFDWWLSGPESHIDADGRFASDIRGRRQRFLTSMDRVQAGKLCLSVAAHTGTCAALQLTMTYASQRKTFAPGTASVPLLHYRPYQAFLLGATAKSYAAAYFLGETRQAFAQPAGTDDGQLYRLLALSKVFVSAHGSDTGARCRERLGAQGLFSANRVITYWVNVQGVVTAEGDNDVLLAKVGWEMLMGTDYTMPEQDAPVAMEAGEPAARLLGIMRHYERMLCERIRLSAMAGAQKPPFELWNSLICEATELARFHADRLAAEAFHRALVSMADTPARGVLIGLLRLFAINALDALGAELLVSGAVSAVQWRALCLEREDLLTALHGEADALLKAFAVPTSLLDAPIGVDFRQAYDHWSGSDRAMSGGTSLSKAA